ncbi:MAG: cytochrome c [Chitinophagales bacterium]|nr:cytochrome c [Chitinophagales bacterium]MCZ2392311.1 cytochrome c [Chitinophagales bacterium]
MLNLNNNHKNLVITSLTVYVFLSILIAVIPAYQLDKVQALPSMEPFSDQQLNGLKIYNSENCMSCHTQQVRNIEMDKVWGERPSIPSDYFYSKKRIDIWRQSPSVLGSERTGPDLTNVGKRQPGKEWHLLHLYNPRTVVKESVMPGYPWLFEEKEASQVTDKDVVIPVPTNFLKDPSKKIIATQKALDLVSYLTSLKQATIGEMPSSDFIPSSKKDNIQAGNNGVPAGLDGALLYTNTCSACHQADGKGLPGAFPPLAGSKIVNDANPESFIKIILQGYDARAEYGVMPPFAENLSDEEVAAIATHERSSWGNNAPAITADDVKKIREMINSTAKK